MKTLSLPLDWTRNLFRAYQVPLYLYCSEKEIELSDSLGLFTLAWNYAVAG